MCIDIVQSSGLCIDIVQSSGPQHMHPQQGVKNSINVGYSIQLLVTHLGFRKFIQRKTDLVDSWIKMKCLILFPSMKKMVCNIDFIQPAQHCCLFTTGSPYLKLSAEIAKRFWMSSITDPMIVLLVNSFHDNQC